MFKLIIFDLDGTLINAYPAVEESVNYVLRYFKRPEQRHEAIERAVGWGPKSLLSAFLDKALLEEALCLYNEHHARALLRGSSLLPGAGVLLTTLKTRGCTLAVASNRPKKFSLIVTRYLAIESMFDRILCGDEVDTPKPHPQMLLQIMDELSFSPEQTLYVGDMTVDVETGRAAGVKTVAVTTGSSSRTEIEVLAPWRIINRVDEVAGLLEKT